MQVSSGGFRSHLVLAAVTSSTRLTVAGVTSAGRHFVYLWSELPRSQEVEVSVFLGCSLCRNQVGIKEQVVCERKRSHRNGALYI